MNTNEGYIEIKKAGDRFHTKISWLDGNHSFSFGPHSDPANTHHGLLLVNNEDYIDPMKGFSTHPHQDMEIVTWMLDGEVEHKDSMGNSGLIYPGLAQRMSAGTGIYHSEMNAKGDSRAHLVQMWVPPVQPRDLGVEAVSRLLDLDGAFVGIHTASLPLRLAKLATQPPQLLLLPVRQRRERLQNPPRVAREHPGDQTPPLRCQRHHQVTPVLDTRGTRHEPRLFQILSDERQIALATQDLPR